MLRTKKLTVLKYFVPENVYRGNASSKNWPKSSVAHKKWTVLKYFVQENVYRGQASNKRLPKSSVKACFLSIFRFMSCEMLPEIREVFKTLSHNNTVLE